MERNYYLVIAKCGHVGNGRYVEITFPVFAKTAHDAAQMVLKRPKVKKHLKNAITNVEEVNYEIYLEELESFSNNPYVLAHTKRELLECDVTISNLEFKKERKTSFSNRLERINYILKKNKIKESQLLC